MLTFILCLVSHLALWTRVQLLLRFCSETSERLVVMVIIGMILCGWMCVCVGVWLVVATCSSRPRQARRAFGTLHTHIHEYTYSLLESQISGKIFFSFDKEKAVSQPIPFVTSLLKCNELL